MAALPAFFGLLVVAVVTAQNVEITPLKAVRRAGDELTVLCKVPYRIDSCRMTVGPTSYRLIPDNQGEVVYAGQGLELGECGAHIKHVKEEWNGNITCVLPPKSGSIEVMGTMQLLVARAPGEPQLIAPAQAAFKEGDILMAQCVVPSGRPAAKITWFLDEEQLLAGTHQPVVTTEPGSDLQTIKQNVSRALAADDNGRRLICRAEHESLDKPKEASRQLLVNYPPKRLDDGPSITIFGLKIAAEGRLNVTVRASPRPRAEWTVGELKLVAPQKNEDASIEALEPVHLGGGYYNVTLVLARVAKEDVDRIYYLTVTNDLGREDFSVRLSTMDEPAGVELETGAIVGIVVGVLVVLIVIFLVVFAKATDRWCFAGSNGVRDHTKSSGESSDTESAVGSRRGALGAVGALGARVRAALPRARDRQQRAAPGPAPDDKVLAEEKKGVVYAELQLGEHAAEKPPPPATEYAEIVYSDQSQQKEAKE